MVVGMLNSQDRDQRDISNVSPSSDLATILSTLPRSGTDDAITRLLDVYEPAERQYRAGAQAGKPVIGASTTTNR